MTDKICTSIAVGPYTITSHGNCLHWHSDKSLLPFKDSAPRGPWCLIYVDRSFLFVFASAHSFFFYSFYQLLPFWKGKKQGHKAPSLRIFCTNIVLVNYTLWVLHLQEFGGGVLNTCLLLLTLLVKCSFCLFSLLCVIF